MAATGEAMMRPVSNALPWLWLSAVLLVLDQATKWLAVSRLEYRQPVVVIEGVWNWTLVHNTGAAFSFLADSGGWQRWFFVVLTLGICSLLTFWLARTPRSDWRTALPFALVIGGGVGNLIDRLRLGYVIDFVDWHWRGWHWPAFNVADSGIVVGAVLIVLLSFRHKEPQA